MAKSSARQWSENALLVTVAGSLIVIIGQLAGTIIPIMYGPEDISDYSISISPIASEIYLDENETTEWKNVMGYRAFIANVSVDDFHKWLRPYRYNVALKISDSDLPAHDKKYVEFNPPEIKPGGISKMTIALTEPEVEFYHPIKIQAVGGDGRRQNTTYYVSIFPTRPEKPKE